MPYDRLADLDVSVRHDGQAIVVAVRGELDAATAPRLRTALDPVLEDGGEPTVVVDLRDVPFIDSSGLKVLVGVSRAVGERGGRLSLVNPSRQVTRLFDLTGVSGVIDVREG